MSGTSVLLHFLRYSDDEGDDEQCTCIIVTIILYTQVFSFNVRTLAVQFSRYK